MDRKKEFGSLFATSNLFSIENMLLLKLVMHSAQNGSVFDVAMHNEYDRDSWTYELR